MNLIRIIAAENAMYRHGRRLLAFVLGIWVAVILSGVQTSARQVQSPPTPADSASAAKVMLDTYCVSCHNQQARVAGLALDNLDFDDLGSHAEVWEKVIVKLRAGSMPPPGIRRPDASSYDTVARWMEDEIDRAWAADPNPGRIAAIHRLNRWEYNNAIRDLFALDIDVKSLVPGDETADGSFDNFANVLSISPVHMERYMSVARMVTRLAVGLPPTNPEIHRFEIPLHVMQDDRQSDDLPIGSRGGIAVPYEFPVDGEYHIQVRLQRQYQDYLKGMGWPQQLDIRLDGVLLERFTIGGNAPGRPAAESYAGEGGPRFAGDPEWEEYMQLTGDDGLEVRVWVSAGPHTVGVSFVRELWEPEGLPQPLQRGRVIANDQVYMGYANVNAVFIGGPYQHVDQQVQDTPSRRAIFICQPESSASELACAQQILARMTRLAYRRPVVDGDIQTLMGFFEAGRQNGGSFEAGIQFALERMLVDPDFLLRVYREPLSATQSASVYRLSDFEVASRLSFFLWSSVPDDRLLTLAEQGRLTDPQTLEGEVRRMLADPRAIDTLVNNFAAQWLNLRRVEEVVVDPDRYPNYDLSLMEAFRRETELFVGSTIQEDRSVAELLSASYTFVNERLARHYGIPEIYGSRFRRVSLPNPSQRGGLLGQGALLATTSYPDRTSPVLRGKWLLDNILSLPVPAPPPGVNTTLPENDASVAAPASIRERLARHRQDPTCNACHSAIDPLGFALENFDVIGGWRTVDESGNPVDASGTTADGAAVEGLAGLRTLLLDRPEQFPRTVTEKLLAFALGRKVEYYDRPEVRRIVREAEAENYSWSSLIQGIVRSPAFLMRASSPETLN